jgi:hypothetical protein
MSIGIRSRRINAVVQIYFFYEYVYSNFLDKWFLENVLISFYGKHEAIQQIFQGLLVTFLFLHDLYKNEVDSKEINNIRLKFEIFRRFLGKIFEMFKRYGPNEILKNLLWSVSDSDRDK